MNRRMVKGRHILLLVIVLLVLSIVVVGSSSHWSFTIFSSEIPHSWQHNQTFFGAPNSTMALDYLTNETNRSPFISGPSLVLFESTTVDVVFNFSVPNSTVPGLYYDQVTVNFSSAGSNYNDAWIVEYNIEDSMTEEDGYGPIQWSHPWKTFTREKESIYLLMPDAESAISYLVSDSYPTMDDESWQLFTQVGNRYEHPYYDWQSAPLGMMYIKIENPDYDTRVIATGWISGKSVVTTFELNTREVFPGDSVSFPMAFINKGYTEFQARMDDFITEDNGTTYELSPLNVAKITNAEGDTISLRNHYMERWMDLSSEDITLWVLAPINVPEADVTGRIQFTFR